MWTLITICTIIYQLPIAWAGELRSVIVIHRHGDRSPFYIYPTDPHPPSVWPNGLGQITNLGKNQTYQLGKYIRERYKDFLPSRYHPNDISVVSSDTDRSLMSAYCVLAGLYEPQGDDVWSEFIKWQPIPVRIIPRSNDNFLNFYVKCPKHKQLLNERFFKVKRRMVNKYKKIMKEVSKNAGEPVSKKAYDTLVLGLFIYNCLYIEEKHGLELPEWTKQFYPEPLRDITILASTMSSYDAPLRRLQCGPLLKEVIRRLEEVREGKSKTKLWHYSGHDQTIIEILQCLDVYDGDLAPYASAVFIELYEAENDFEIAVHYKKNNEVKELKIPGCTSPCKFDLFKELKSEVIPDNWKEECKKEKKIN